MEFLEVIKKRRSVRRFTDQSISQDIIKKLIEIAIWAPSACNVQGWHFIVIDNPDVKRRLVDAGAAPTIKNAPMGILVLYDNRTTNTRYFDHLQSAAAAVENLLLAATDMDLAGCWICHLPPKNQVRKILGIPGWLDPTALVLLGYPASTPAGVERKYELEEIINYNRFTHRPDKEPIDRNGLAIKKILIKIYYRLPVSLKRLFFNNYLDKKFTKKFDN